MDLQQEQELIIKAQAGDKEALGQIWDELTPKLFGYLVNTLKHKGLAEDVLQSTWLKAIEALPRFKYRGQSISSWLFMIARNECRQHWRKAKWETPMEDTDETAQSATAQTDENLMVKQILNLLSQDDRELLRLRYISDLTISEVARVLNINSITARVRLHRAIKRAQNLSK